MPERDVRKVLLLRFSSLGDIVMLTPAVRALRKRFPMAQIDMVVREDFFDLIAANPHLDRKIAFSRSAGLKGLRKLVQDINHQGYDIIYDAHWSLRTLLLMPFLKANVAKVRYQKHYFKRSLGLLFKLRSFLENKRFLEKFIDPLTTWGVTYDGLGPEVFLPKDASTSQKAKYPVPDCAPHLRIGLIPSAQWPGKRWAPENFRKLLTLLIEKTPHQVVVFGGPSDTFCESIVQGFSKDRVFNSQGKLKLRESMALVKDCDLVIANDTGLMHVADALNVPPVLIFGPTSEELGCLPFHPQRQILEHKLWCRPCSKNGQAPCIRKERLCLTLTSPEDVFQATLQLITMLRTKAC